MHRKLSVPSEGGSDGWVRQGWAPQVWFMLLLSLLIPLGKVQAPQQSPKAFLRPHTHSLGVV